MTDGRKSRNRNKKISETEPRTFHGRGQIFFSGSGIESKGFNESKSRKSSDNRQSSRNSRGRIRGNNAKNNRTGNNQNNNREIKITLHEIRKNLSDETLKKLLKNNFDPNEVITIIQKITPLSFAEDVLITKSIKNKKPKKKKIKTFNINCIDKYLKYKDGIPIKLSNELCFGCYLYYYEKYFEEKDPEWVNTNSKKAIFIINKMVVDVLNGNHQPIIDYIENVFPLWALRMKRGKEFPNFRPNLDILFVKRKMWAQRHNLYRRWKQEEG